LKQGGDRPSGERGVSFTKGSSEVSQSIPSGPWSLSGGFGVQKNRLGFEGSFGTFLYAPTKERFSKRLGPAGEVSGEAETEILNLKLQREKKRKRNLSEGLKNILEMN